MIDSHEHDVYVSESFERTDRFLLLVRIAGRTLTLCVRTHGEWLSSRAGDCIRAWRIGNGNRRSGDSAFEWETTCRVDTGRGFNINAGRAHCCPADLAVSGIKPAN